MTVIRIDKNGIPRDLFSGKIVDLKPNLPKHVKRQYESSAKDLNKGAKETAERTLIIARVGY